MKTSEEKDEVTGTDQCLRGIVFIFCFVCMLGAFCAVNILQYREIWMLKDRVAALENRAYILPENVLEDTRSSERLRRSVAPGSLSGLITSLVDQEVKVLENYCGNSSKICLPGPKGDTGQKGDIGVTGTKGASGPGGPPGVKGTTGQYGIAGFAGPQGDPGNNGTSGPKGEMGAKGEKGDLGLRGIPGPKGAQGIYGAAGIPGFKGDPGTPGTAGLKGQQGDEGRPLPLSQQCCSSLSKPSVEGNATALVRAYVGQTVVLPCRTHGSPPPIAVFTPSTDPLGRNRFSVSPAGMEIQNLALTDSGRYTCTVDTVLGHSQKTIQLIVTDQVVATTVPTTLNINEGDAIIINCDVSGSPQPSVTWHHQRPDGTNVVVPAATGTVPGRSSVRIPLAHALDAGSYTCTAENQYEKDEATTVVSVLAKPQIVNPPHPQTVLEGATVTLQCGVIGTPPNTVTWTFPLTGNNPPLNALLAPDNSVQLSSVDRFNSGTYTCTATNAQGTTAASANVTVELGVTVTAVPHLMPVSGRPPVVNLQCLTTGSPAPTITWTKGGTSLAGNSKYLALHGGNLIITRFDADNDTGEYECTGRNPNGNDTDNSLVYMNQGQLNCTATFGDTQCSGTQICGGKCPANCLFIQNNLYGFRTYPAMSPICIAAIHTGTLPTPDGIVTWQHVTQLTTYTATNRNGIQSLGIPATADANTILQHSGTQTSGPNPVPAIG